MINNDNFIRGRSTTDCWCGCWWWWWCLSFPILVSSSPSFYLTFFSIWPHSTNNQHHRQSIDRWNHFESIVSMMMMMMRCVPVFFILSFQNFVWWICFLYEQNFFLFFYDQYWFFFCCCFIKWAILIRYLSQRKCYDNLTICFRNFLSTGKISPNWKTLFTEKKTIHFFQINK